MYDPGCHLTGYLPGVTARRRHWWCFHWRSCYWLCCCSRCCCHRYGRSRSAVFEATCWIISPMVPTSQSDTPPVKRVPLPVTVRLVQKSNTSALVYPMRNYHFPAKCIVVASCGIFICPRIIVASTILVASEASSGISSSVSNEVIILGSHRLLNWETKTILLDASGVYRQGRDNEL